MSNPNTTAIKRIQRELKDLRENPVPDVSAEADPENILVIFFVLDGASDTPYAGGEYLGRMLLPATYPFAPPSFMMMTPSGRFQTETSICTSFSSYHPATWSPSWNIGSMASGLLSFMSTTDVTAGSVTTTDETKRTLAAQSRAFNMKQPKYRALFGERHKKSQQMVADAAAAAAEEEKKKQDNKAAASNSPAAAAAAVVTSAPATPPQNNSAQDPLPTTGTAAVTATDVPAPAAGADALTNIFWVAGCAVLFIGLIVVYVK